MKCIDYLKNGFVFKIIYLLHTLLCFNSLFVNRPILVISSYILTFIGFIYLIFRIFHYSKYMRTKGIVFLILFVLSFVISALLNINYGITENIKGAVWMVFQFFLIYAYDITESREKTKTELKIFSHIFLAYTSLMALIGFILLFSNYNYYGIYKGKTIIIGFIWNRLWGLYSDPNYGAVFGVISFALCIYYLIHSKKRMKKSLYIIMALFQVAYISFSDSRTALVAFMITFGIISFLFLIRWQKKYLRKKVINVFTALFLSLIAFIAPYFFTRTIAVAGSNVLQSIHGNNYSEIPIDEDLPFNENLNIGRNDSDINNDISNRRFAIWNSAIEIFLTKPLVGVSFRNIVNYAENVLPKTYIVNNDFTSFASMHNVFIDILVSQGIIGILFFMLFVVVIVFTILKNLFKKDDKQYFDCLFLISILLPIAISAMFYSEILYINTATSVFFWFALGCLIKSLLQKNDKCGEVGIITFHNARNYGACLQTFALQKKIEEMGHTVNIVDYRPSAIENNFGIIIKSRMIAECKSLVSAIKFSILTVLCLPWRTLKENKFISFCSDNYNLTDETYSNIKQIQLAAKQNKLDYKFYIFGSDQIWNPIITEGVDSVYYGDFAAENSIKAAYAASTGSIFPTPEQQNDIKQQLNNLDYISVREAASKKWLSKLTDKEIRIVVDPTLLLKPSVWESYCGKCTIKKPYILVYVLEHNRNIINMVSALAKEKKMPVVFFDLKNRFGCKAYSKMTADPFEFISYLKGAEYVITNSFHGTVFSIIFQKQFLCVPNKTNPTRMVELLKKLGLEKQLAYSSEDINLLEKEIDFKNAHDIINNLCKESQTYLEEVFSSEGGKKSNE